MMSLRLLLLCASHLIRSHILLEVSLAMCSASIDTDSILRACISLNNQGVVLLARHCYREAHVILKDALLVNNSVQKAMCDDVSLTCRKHAPPSRSTDCRCQAFRLGVQGQYFAHDADIGMVDSVAAVADMNYSCVEIDVKELAEVGCDRGSAVLLHNFSAPHM